MAVPIEKDILLFCLIWFVLSFVCVIHIKQSKDTFLFNCQTWVEEIGGGNVKDCVPFKRYLDIIEKELFFDFLEMGQI